MTLVPAEATGESRILAAPHRGAINPSLKNIIRSCVVFFCSVLVTRFSYLAVTGNRQAKDLIQYPSQISEHCTDDAASPAASSLPPGQQGTGKSCCCCHFCCFCCILQCMHLRECSLGVKSSCGKESKREKNVTQLLYSRSVLFWTY